MPPLESECPHKSYDDLRKLRDDERDFLINQNCFLVLLLGFSGIIFKYDLSY